MCRTLILSFLLVAASSSATSTSIFNFDSDTVGKLTPFTDTNNGVSATFSSSTGNEFYVGGSFFFTQTVKGNLLFAGPGLIITFDQSLSSISLNFVQNVDFTLFLTAFTDAIPVGSSMATGMPRGDNGFPEGSIAFSSGTFNRVVFTSTTPALGFSAAFGIDEIAVNPASAIPEPTGFALAVLGVCLLFPAIRHHCKLRNRRNKFDTNPA